MSDSSTAEKPGSPRWSERLATYLLPPLGLILVWRRPGASITRRIGSSVWILLYCLPYSGLWLLALVQLGVLALEWKGGFPPVLTLHKTVPDYQAVEEHRAGQQAGSVRSIPLETKPSGSAYWTGFRGPKRDGHYAQTPIRTEWPEEGLAPIWKQPIGGGYASFAVADGTAFTIEQRRGDEVVTAYEVRTGRELWAHAYPEFFDESMGGEGPRATPAWDEGRVYALGAAGEFHCLDAGTGEVQWRRNILKENHAANLHWAQSASPLIVENKVIVQPGGAHGRSVIAYDKVTGAEIWSVLDDQAAYSSPMLVDLAGERQLLVSVNDRMVGLRPEDGELLWEFPWVVGMGNRNIAQPVLLSENGFLLSAGYGTGCAAVEISANAEGFSARELWSNKNLKNKFTSSVFFDGCVYGLDESILTCIRAGTGERMWKDGRYEYGQVLLASGQLIVQCGNGDLAVVRAVPDEFIELTRFAALPGKTWNHPAMSDGCLLVRNAVEMACYDLRAD